MSKAPERIWLLYDEFNHWNKSADFDYPGTEEYIRADLYEAQSRELANLKSFVKGVEHNCEQVLRNTE